MRNQDLGDAGHHEELECQRSAPNSLLYSVLGEFLESLHRNHDEEVEWNLEDVHQYHPKRELECQRAARQAA